jgi:V/A-type H+-transporting ATPase subunit D
MSKLAISGIRPTRIELLKLKRQEVLAQRGHDLLEEKLDAMVMEFFRYLDSYIRLKREVQKDVDRALDALSAAHLVIGRNRLEEIAGSTPKMDDLSMDTRSIMGVRVPGIVVPETLRTYSRTGYSYLGTNTHLDSAVTLFENSTRKILELAELEGTVRRLALEIRNTRRRVNALENILIPRLQATRRYIEMHLEEREREDLFRRKRTKNIIQAH